MPNFPEFAPPLRVGVVGARRREQGIGEHVARYLHARGAEVRAIAGTQADTVAAACRQLESRWGIAARGYVGLEAMLRSEELDGLAICSPERFHRQHLQAALEHGLHVLCEKPLVFEPGRDPVADARPLVEGFARAGKLLAVNEQWPYTLPYFAALHPEARLGEQRPQRLAVLLSPAVAGRAMVVNAMPHVLSLLFALCPAGGEAEGIEVQPWEADGARPYSLRIGFCYRHAAGQTEVDVALRHAPAQPRPAAYAIDGRAVWRVIDTADYTISFVAGMFPGDVRADGDVGLPSIPTQQPGLRRLPIPDPLGLLVADFLSRAGAVQQGGPFEPPLRDGTLLERLTLLAQIDRAAAWLNDTADLPPAPAAAGT